MRLTITSLLSVVLEEDVQSLRGEDASGSFGILQGHADFLTALEISIVSWRCAHQERFCAVRGGVLTVTGGTFIAIATREAVVGDTLATLDRDVLTRFCAQADAQRVDRSQSLQLQLSAIRRMVSRLQTGTQARALR